MPYYEFKPIRLDNCLDLGHDLPKAFEQAHKHETEAVQANFKSVRAAVTIALTLIPTIAMIGLACIMPQFWGFFGGGVLLISILFRIRYDENAAHKAKWSRFLADDRFKLVQSLLEDIRVWNEEVALFNRLLDQMNLELIDKIEVQDVIDRLRDDKKFLQAKIEYTTRRLRESKLGEPLVRSLPPTAILDDTADWRERVRDNRRELENTAGRMLARYETEAALKR